ncbi:ABC transporter substrate-binding protein [Nocardiopsis lambiniae]|uniref:ABC transporter substrate-binding protein n=1 Tax=Nocardiopsis lambiniae TaxID=3075539 RepID=A0ABU2MDC6_9ACTN|nr:ABC transporter substrate-binding protein [Nocardiopsis sp. DSM 44743]MDT0329931.1 ABC transporter substrate-binding protein [Nocardiopsis sp. DSM 44743]
MCVPSPPKRIAPASLALGLALAVTGCAADAAEDDALTLGYFPNLTHAPALVGVENGIFAEALGDTAFDTRTFNGGPDAVNALFSGEIDAAYLGPSPAVNGWFQSEGRALHIVAGAATRGTGLVVRDDITDVEDLVGTTLATPQLGGTQDVALRWFAREQGWEVDTAGGGDLSIVPQANPETVDAFAIGEIDGAWVPEPYLGRLLAEDDAHLLVDEADLWPGGEFVTTHLVVSAALLRDHPERVEDLLRGHIQAVDLVDGDPDTALRAVSAHLETLTGGAPDPDLTAAGLDNITFTVDPAAHSLLIGADRAEAIGLLEPVDLTGIYALDPLNALLAEDGRERVAGLEG